MEGFTVLLRGWRRPEGGRGTHRGRLCRNRPGGMSVEIVVACFLLVGPGLDVLYLAS